MSPLDSTGAEATGPAPTAVDRVADAVRAEILTGALPADAPLREEAAAARSCWRARIVSRSKLATRTPR